MALPPASGPSPEHFTLDSNDRMLAALGYVFLIVAIVVALMNETKSKPLLKDHAVQGIGFGVASFAYFTVAGVIYLCLTIATLGILGLVLWVLFLVPTPIGLYFGYMAYTNDGLVEIPLLTDLMAEQGWFETRKPV
ncbi:MAG: hypothetical protein R3A46_19780 [Thermomicrobiales bacterium]